MNTIPPNINVVVIIPAIPANKSNLRLPIKDAIAVIPNTATPNIETASNPL